MASLVSYHSDSLFPEDVVNLADDTDQQTSQNIQVTKEQPLNGRIKDEVNCLQLLQL